MTQDAQTHREHGDLDLVRIVMVGLIGAASLLVLVEGVRAWVSYMKADEVQQKVLEHETALKWTDGNDPKRFIHVPGKIINIVV